MVFCKYIKSIFECTLNTLVFLIMEFAVTRKQTIFTPWNSEDILSLFPYHLEY